MKINYENVVGEPDGKQFMTDVQLIMRRLFPAPQKAAVIRANASRYVEDIKRCLALKGYAYNRANIDVNTVHGELQGIMVAVHGEAGDAETVDDWQDGGMVARFTLDIDSHGIVEEFKP